ncbi:pentatricopeptide repeat-containing protein At1g74630-like [Coffea arabica]|uniref:Pentatricopeptide repeat-containing protein At1g74630-like n=1 Tax=Coffea arabica TaxID=13443 RepID=A0A6P6XB59_COFAR|nr:pentatricopeptide repeat-containing protein At1g74630-like [Coffea arabica]XP_027121758.1 pentatricopeptide repeat-containing protein At1g74630-like [Coffea arabica]XP_027121759.1 pentatricopeptide repeat-containing protein At1g74630-like [Coffea arabica]XP_027121760.1 pentatricopeptide repeat-containing protein At1g74630-like [Coffea arabica]XP_027121761.1 pentatricopeptide repeat-containing protein At1g74630-like [Coffea arabica]XP_027121762.1 pentatricopeptide repeat-containing protein A
MSKPHQFSLSLLTNCKTLKSLKQIHAQVLKKGLDSDPFVAGKLLLHCSINLSDSLDYAHRLFTYTPNPDAFMYNTLIRGLGESETPQKSLSIFTHMLGYSNFPPDSFSFAFLLKGAANARCLRMGSQLHCQALVRGLDSHAFVGTTIVSMYAECGIVGFSRKMFDEMPEPNVVAWNAMLTAYFRCYDLKGAEGIFYLMPFRDLTSMNVMLAGYTKVGELELAKKLFLGMLIKDDVSWSTIIIGLAQSGSYDEALSYFRELRRLGLTPNEVSLTGVLSACAQSGALAFAITLHGFIEKSGMVWILSVNNALLDTYSKCGSLDMACLVFKRMPGKKSIVSWTSMVTGLAMQGYGEGAIKLFNEMKESGIKPDGITFIAILKACSHAGLIEQGYKIFSKMTEEYGIDPTIEHYGCVVDLYGRAGLLQKAYDFVIQMPIPPTAIIWRTLLGACSFFGDVVLAERVKERLAKADPDNSGDHVLLSNTYAVAGKQNDVVMIRESMAELKMKKIPGWSMIEVDKF